MLDVFVFGSRVLLRVRLMYYIKHEVIGDLAHQIADGVNARYLFTSFLFPFSPYCFAFITILMTF